MNMPDALHARHLCPACGHDLQEVARNALGRVVFYCHACQFTCDRRIQVGPSSTPSPAGQEIERKFLVADVDDWRAFRAHLDMSQGYLRTEGSDEELRVRVVHYDAIAGDRYGLVTIKRGSGLVRAEAEVRVAYPLAADLLELAGSEVVSKRRLQGPDGWVLDSYVGAMTLRAPLVAEIELPHADAPLPPIPSGLVLGEEVTGRPEYANQTIAKFGFPGLCQRPFSMSAARIPDPDIPLTPKG